MRDRILVTPRSLTSEPHPHVERLREGGWDIVYSKAGTIPHEAELIELVPGCRGWLAGVEPVSERVIEAADTLQIISRNGTGIDNLPLPLLRQKGVKVAVAEGANARGVAELAIGLMFCALRSIPLSDAGIKRGAWPRRRGFEISGRTVGVIGCGAIGREVARMAAALGAHVLAYDPARPEISLPTGSFGYATIPDLLAASDVVTLHCPPARDGRPLIDATALVSMRPQAVLLNTARAALVDERAVLDALDDGRLAAYAIDVFDAEPPTDLVLAGHQRVIATSHIGGFTEESVDRATRIAVANLVSALRRSPHG